MNDSRAWVFVCAVFGLILGATVLGAMAALGAQVTSRTAMLLPSFVAAGSVVGAAVVVAKSTFLQAGKWIAVRWCGTIAVVCAVVGWLLR